MTRIVWTEPAVADMEAIRAYIARDNEVYADAIVMGFSRASSGWNVILFPEESSRNRAMRTSASS